MDSVTHERAAQTVDGYTVRPYTPSDRATFLSLYETVFGEPVDGWFEWKYESNPHIDHVPMIVALEDDTMVGAKPCFTLKLTAGPNTLLGLQPADVMVHEAHRRRGLYSRMTEQLKSEYRDSEAELFFNYPNAATLEGSLKHGWQVVEPVPTFYRIQDPASILADSPFSPLSVPARLAVSAMNRARDRLFDVPADVTVQRYDTVPEAPFLELYARSPPTGFHATRDSTFYRWRFGNPRWTYRAYLARRRDRPLAGIVTATGVYHGRSTTRIVDVEPLCQARGRTEGLRALLQTVIKDASSVELLAASGRVVPQTLLRAYGFLSDQRLPLRLGTESTVQVTYPTDGEWTVACRAIADPTNWCVTFPEQDSS